MKQNFRTDANGLINLETISTLTIFATASDNYEG